MMEIAADWIMITKNYMYLGVKKRKHGEKLMSLSELQEMANGIIERDARHHSAYKYVFNDRLVVREGVFKWDEDRKSFKKIADHFDKISKPSPLWY